jgi:hypothetical protein
LGFFQKVINFENKNLKTAMAKLKEEKTELKEDFLKIMSPLPSNPNQKMEWVKPGDFFVKFSMFHPYTPVKTAANSQLIHK